MGGRSPNTWARRLGLPRDSRAVVRLDDLSSKNDPPRNYTSTVPRAPLPPGSEQVVLPALSGNRSFQRLVSEYYDTLEFTSNGVHQSQPPQDRRATAAASPSPAESSGGRGVPSATGSGSSSGPPRYAAGSAAGSGSGSTRANGGSSAASKGEPPRIRIPAATGAAALNGETSVANGGGAATAAAAVTPGKGGKAGVNDGKQVEGNGSTATATGSSAT